MTLTVNKINLELCHRRHVANVLTFVGCTDQSHSYIHEQKAFADEVLPEQCNHLTNINISTPACGFVCTFLITFFFFFGGRKNEHKWILYYHVYHLVLPFEPGTYIMGTSLFLALHTTVDSSLFLNSITHFCKKWQKLNKRWTNRCCMSSDLPRKHDTTITIYVTCAFIFINAVVCETKVTKNTVYKMYNTIC